MKHSDFRIGMEFLSAGGTRRWLVTDVGTRVVVAIRIDEAEMRIVDEGRSARQSLTSSQAREMGWFNGPPYGVAEVVFDEDDQIGCEPA